ncbi:hypothetical protein HDU82_001292 [Entophlyctis luteolus]|nr:hypothetical protein HDU82_001292 [Entophlyctis luteolus]
MRHYQCGGVGFVGAECCVAGNVCVYQNPYYSQCVPVSSTLTSIEPPSAAVTAAAASATAASVASVPAASQIKPSATTMAVGVADDVASDGSVSQTNNSSTLYSSVVAGSIGGAICVIVAFGILAFRRRGTTKRSTRKSTKYSFVSEYADGDDVFNTMSAPQKAHV